jgi:steroid delta-isomerase-like uncharacterized protein
MAEQESIRIVQENIAAFNAGDAARVGATLAENPIYQEFATQRTAKGKQSVVQATMQWKQAFPDATGTIERIVANGNTVAAEILWRGTHQGTLSGPAGAIPATGKQVQVRASQVITIEGGKLAQTNHYFDMATLLQQLGAWQQQQQQTAQQAISQQQATQQGQWQQQQQQTAQQIGSQRQTTQQTGTQQRQTAQQIGSQQQTTQQIGSQQQMGQQTASQQQEQQRTQQTES